MDVDELAEQAAAAAKQAKRATWACVFLVCCAVGVLAIDNGIKRQILDEARKLRAILDEARPRAAAAGKTEEAAADGPQAAGETGAPAGANLNGRDAVVPDTGTPAATAGDAKLPPRAQRGGPRSTGAGARGDG